MNSRGPRLELAVGAFLVLALASLLVLAFATTNGKWGLGGNTYPIKAKFPTTGALRINAPVKVGGVAIGSVAKIELDKNYDAVTILNIEKKYSLSADTSASILTSGLLGESYVNLQPGGDPESLKAGDELFLTQGAVDLMGLVGKFMFSSGQADDKQNSDKATEAPVEEKVEKPAEQPKSSTDDDLPDYLKDIE